MKNNEFIEFKQYFIKEWIVLMCFVQNMDIKYKCECVVIKFIVSLILFSIMSLL